MIMKSRKELEEEMLGKGCELCRLKVRHEHKHDRILYISPCHPDSGLHAAYQQGGLVLSCFTCGRTVAAFGIVGDLADFV